MFIIFSEFAPLIINTELCVTSGDQFSVSLCCCCRVSVFPSSLLPPVFLLYVSVCVHVFVLSNYLLGYFLFYFDGELV